MGWLENLAKEQGHASLRATAVAMRDSPRWPRDDDRNIETIANKLRHADKGTDVDWWTGTGRALLPALAHVLNEDQDELTERLELAGTASRDPGSTLWRFSLFPALRPLDLRTEPLFPGIPTEIAGVGGPRAARTWWVARPGAGKTIVGKWLAAKYGWTVAPPSRWSEFDPPEHGRVFIELTSMEGLTPQSLEALPKALKLCIAATQTPRIEIALNQEAMPIGSASSAVIPLPSRPGSARSPLADFEIVTTPPGPTWVSALIGWAAARIKSGGGFDGARVQQMFRQPSLQGLFETPGELLGFLGMVDHIGIDKVESAQNQPYRWIRAWLNALIDRPDRPQAAGIAELLRARGTELLVDIERERIRLGLAPDLREADWASLVPHADAPPIDRERLLALARSRTGDALEQIQVALHPDPGSIVRGLIATGILATTSSDQLALCPTWVANTVEHIATDQLYRSGPDGIGALVLFPRTAELAINRLVDEVRKADTSRVAECAAISKPQSPEQMAALDAAFRSIGLAALEGTALPPTLLTKVWDRQMAYAAQRYPGWPPHPVTASLQLRHGVASIGAWFLAALAISRALFAAEINLPCSALNPWAELPSERDERDQLLEAISIIAGVFAQEEDASLDPRQLEVYRLGGDLFDRHKVLRHRARLLEAQGPDLVVQLALDDALEVSVDERNELLGLRFGLHALEDACRRRQTPLNHVLTFCWSHWRNDPARYPPLVWLRDAQRDTHDDVRHLWLAAPESAMTSALYTQLEGDQVVEQVEAEVWEWLTEPLWSRWLRQWGDDPQRHRQTLPFCYLPEHLALQALREGRIDAHSHEIRAILWARMHALLISLIDELAMAPLTPTRVGLGTIADLVWTVPDIHCPALIERARRWLVAPERFPATATWIQRWLMDVIQKRSPGWRDAYDALITHMIAAVVVDRPAMTSPGLDGKRAKHLQNEERSKRKPSLPGSPARRGARPNSR